MGTGLGTSGHKVTPEGLLNPLDNKVAHISPALYSRPLGWDVLRLASGTRSRMPGERKRSLLIRTTLRLQVVFTTLVTAN